MRLRAAKKRIEKPKPKVVESKKRDVFVTPRCSVSWANLSATEVIDGKDTKKYSLSILLDPQIAEHEKFLGEIEELQGEGKALMVAHKGDKIKSYSVFQPAKIKLKRDEAGELVETELREIKFKTRFEPLVRDLTKEKVDPALVTPGSEVVIAFVPEPFAMGEKKMAGATMYLQEVALIKKGEGYRYLDEIIDQYAQEIEA